jgi:hypothetical protein
VRAIIVTPVPTGFDTANEWDADAYPGQGAWELPNGKVAFIFRSGGPATMNIVERVNVQTVPEPMDVHRLLDQLAALQLGHR